MDIEHTYDCDSGFDAATFTAGLFGDWNGPAIGLMDLDAFFASVEQLDHPQWRGKPVIVGGARLSAALSRPLPTRREPLACIPPCPQRKRNAFARKQSGRLAISIVIER